jgi:hypothetical protein
MRRRKQQASRENQQPLVFPGEPLEALPVVSAEWPRPNSTPMLLPTLPPDEVTSADPLDPTTVAQKMRWFRNIKRQPFDSGNLSLDYSLQLYEGIKAFCASEGCDSR